VLPGAYGVTGWSKEQDKQSPAGFSKFPRAITFKSDEIFKIPHAAQKKNKKIRLSCPPRKAKTNAVSS